MNIRDIRNEQIIARRCDGASLAAISNEFGLTRERVRQIISQSECSARQPSEWTIVRRTKDNSTAWKTRRVERHADSDVTLLIVTMIAVTKDDADGNPVPPQIKHYAVSPPP